MMKAKPFVALTLSVLVGLLALSGAAFARDEENRNLHGQENREKTIPEDVNPGLNHLLDLVTPGKAESLDMQAVKPVLDFVASDKSPDDIFVADNSFGAPSAYIEVDLNQSLEDLLQISYNPDIPAYLLTPSSMRLGYWKTVSQGKESYANLWERLSGLTDPILVRGVETVENTPDIHTGAYYKYDLDRLLILFKYQGRNVFLSLSRQKDRSDVGKKGIVLGDDKDWNYLYSGEKGINKFGLGWVDSYMYESSSIIVYYESEPGKPRLRCAVFKWLKAGWKNINMVKSHHIYNGMQRWAKDYKTIVEHPNFPGSASLVNAWTQIEAIDVEELKRVNHLYYQSLQKRYADDDAVSSRWAAGVLEDESRIDQCNVHELRSVVVIEYLKSVLGKPYEVDVLSRYGLDSGKIKLSRN
ncbi:MAG: hypothetical protein LJE94_15385 [Deltaproteobacteria bacterium]|nr:hypothetical protein [Deltaproteobacteria bacterium]